jgi:hypothetical protein
MSMKTEYIRPRQANLSAALTPKYSFKATRTGKQKKALTPMSARVDSVSLFNRFCTQPRVVKLKWTKSNKLVNE